MGAPQKCVTLVLGDGLEDCPGLDPCAGTRGCPHRALIAQVKHQPLQWNMGRVQR